MVRKTDPPASSSSFALPPIQSTSKADKKRNVPERHFLVRRLRLRKDVWMRCFIAAVATHYCFLILSTHGLIRLDPARLLEDLDLPVSKSMALLPRSFGSLPKKEKQELIPTNARFVVGIETNDYREDEQQRREQLRNTYLKYYQTSSEEPTNRICKLQDLKQDFDDNMKISKKFEDCQFAYTFVMKIVPSKDTSSWILDQSEVPNAESDVLYLNRNKQGKNAWLEYSTEIANKLSFDYIAWIDTETVFIPPTFFDSIRYLPTNHVASTKVVMYGETNMSPRSPGCMDCFYDNDVKRMRGRMYFFSLDVAHSLTSSESKVGCNMYDNNDGSMKRCIQRIKGVKNFDLGHYYKESTVSGFQSAWDQYINASKSQKKLSSDAGTFSVSYLIGKFGRNRLFSKEIASSKNLVVAHAGLRPDQVFVYDDFPDFITSDVRWEPHLEFMQDTTLSTLGGGYWFWRGPLLEHHLAEVKDGDFVILGNTNIWDHLPWINELMEAMINRNANLFLYQLGFLEKQWTKRDAYEVICPGKDVPSDQSNQYSTGLILLRKSPGTVLFVKNWSNAMSNYHILTDEASLLPEFPDFTEHRRDQSLMSLTLKCKHNETGKQELQLEGMNKLGWFHGFTFQL